MFFNWTLLPLIYRSKNHIKIEEFPTTLLICGFYFENGVLGVAKNSKRQNIQELPLLATLLTAHHFCLKFSLIVGKIFLTLRIYLSWIPADDLTQQGGFFNWSARLSVPKWKNLLSQRGAFLHLKFREKPVLVGCNLFFILYWRTGGSVKKTTLYKWCRIWWSW